MLGYVCKYKCAVCGKMTAGRLPGYGRRRGDTSEWFPRRHKVNGVDCPGNIQYSIWVEVPLKKPVGQTDKKK